MEHENNELKRQNTKLLEENLALKAKIANMKAFYLNKLSHSHGPDEFVQFDSNTLSPNLLRFQQFKEKNLLILGQTGVGKSTWINALANQITFQTMDEALQADKPICLIPAQFSLTNDQFESVSIKICPHGIISDCFDCKNSFEDINENFTGAESSTIYPRGYIFKSIKGGPLRIIDTPGIGDTRRIDQDKENVNNIIRHISTLKQIDCICILLKPNESRLNSTFRYCLQELLASLHRNAAKNIVFCFTHSRGTLYRPGDTLKPLKIQLDELAQKTGIRIELKKENVFCVDNEAFRFLCAVKANFKFSEDDFNKISESWCHSYREFDRLLKYMDDCLVPHCTQETIALNEARNIIFTLSKPLAEISKNIQTYIVRIQNEEERLKRLDTGANDFKFPSYFARLMLNKNANNKATKQKEIDEFKKIVKQFEEEQKFINNVAAQAGIYLKKNSIVSINDGIEKYLKMQIKEVEHEDVLLKDNRRLELLKNSLEAYRKECEILEKSFSARQENEEQQQEEMTPDNIKQLIDKLIKLPLSGEQIKRYIDCQLKEIIFNRNEPSRDSNHSSYNQHITQTSSSTSGHGSHSPCGSSTADDKEK